MYVLGRIGRKVGWSFVGLAALCLAVCAEQGLAFGIIWVLAYLPVRTPAEFQRLPGLKLYVACPAFV